MLKLWKTFCRKSTNFQDCAELHLSFQQVINTLLHLEPQIGLFAKFFTFPLCQYLFEIFFIFSKKSSFSKTARFFRSFEFVFFTKFCFFVVFLMLFRFCCCILWLFLCKITDFGIFYRCFFAFRGVLIVFSAVLPL